MAEQKAKNITWHASRIKKSDREKLTGQKGVVVWFTGLSGSGKSTVANLVEKELYDRGRLSYRLDGDNIRHGLNKNLGFSPEDREENIRRIGEVAKLFADAGIIALTSFISPYARDRDAARSLVEEGEFIEVYVRCPVDECEVRDPKGLYEKARKGIIKEFTGISAPYEEPENAEIVLETEKETEEESAQKIMEYLEDKGVI